MARNQGSRAAKSQTIGFRLDGYELDLLKAAAAKQNMSPGEFARRATVQAVTHGAAVLEAIQKLECELREAVERLNDNVKTSTIGLLADAGQTSLDQAEAWVKEHLEANAWGKDYRGER